MSRVSGPIAARGRIATFSAVRDAKTATLDLRAQSAMRVRRATMRHSAKASGSA
jgi:hypothetical protein